jgi:DNA-binding PadR family transcriptional regulator
VNQGSLYPALQRLKSRGLIRAEWRTTENNRRARYYVITKAGERELARQRSQWERSVVAVNWVLDAMGGRA